MAVANDGTGRPVLRRDAQRSIEKITAAALELFTERGLDCPLEEIARRAGVSPGTIYHRFGSREALIDAVAPDLAAAKLSRAIDEAGAREGAWERFYGYVEAISFLMTTDAALSDAFARRYDDTPRLGAVCEEALAHGAVLVKEAHESGELRDDFLVEDLMSIFLSVAAVSRSVPGAWRRALAFTLDGLRASAAPPPGP